jgi:hypothetical protein
MGIAYMNDRTGPNWKHHAGVEESTTRILDFITGSLKAATTDFIGAPVDITNEILGAVSGGRVKSEKPIGGSKYLREKLLGPSQVENRSAAETLGTFVDPRSAVKSMIIAAAAKPERFIKYMEASSAKPAASQAELFNETGIYRDTDSAYKTILSDSNSSINSNSTGVATDLGSLLHHPELFAIYPSLKKIPVEWDKTAPAGAGGLRVDNSRMRLSPHGSPETVHELVLHETQHAIQHSESFARGADPKQFISYDIKAAQLNLTKMKAENLPQNQKLIEQYEGKIKSDIKRANTQYLNSAGEQEARFTEISRKDDTTALAKRVLQTLRTGETPQTFDTKPLP